MGVLASPAGRPRRSTAALVAVACALGLLAASAPAAGVSGSSDADGNSWRRGALDPGLPVSGGGLQRVVVTGVTGSLEVLRRAVAAVGGDVGRPLPLVDGVSATVPAGRLPELAAADGVRAVTADRSAKLWTTGWDDSLSASSFVWTSGTNVAWQAGARGTGVGVAVLDTGVSAHADLAGRLLHGPDLSGEAVHDVDTYGHGTVMAGLVAGSGAAAAPTPRTGVAPGAHVVSVKVAGRNGATDVSTVLAGMHWVAAFKDTYKIRVMNLSWGVPSTQDPAVDPLSHAVQRLWQLGITVVVAAGNSGPTRGTITKPGDDPVVLTVGAYDDRGDLNLSNDVVPHWSSQGPTAQGVRKPDLVAPGRTVVAARAAGSYVEQQNPKAHVAPSYIKGSGSSQAAAVTSGAAALLLAARPHLTPDQVKAALLRSAAPIPNVAATAQGAGRLQAGAALTADVTVVPAQPLTGAGTGALDASRGTMARVEVVCNGVAKTLNDETTSWCSTWEGASWRDASWTADYWQSDGWTAMGWSADAWSGASWRGASWRGASWRTEGWSGASWRTTSWTSDQWTSAEYGDEEFLAAFWGEHTRPGRPLPGERTEDDALRRAQPSQAGLDHGQVPVPVGDAGRGCLRAGSC